MAGIGLGIITIETLKIELHVMGPFFRTREFHDLVNIYGI